MAGLSPTFWYNNIHCRPGVPKLILANISEEEKTALFNVQSRGLGRITARYQPLLIVIRFDLLKASQLDKIISSNIQRIKCQEDWSHPLFYVFISNPVEFYPFYQAPFHLKLYRKDYHRYHHYRWQHNFDQHLKYHFPDLLVWPPPVKVLLDTSIHPPDKSVRPATQLVMSDDREIGIIYETIGPRQLRTNSSNILDKGGLVNTAWKATENWFSRSFR